MPSIPQSYRDPSNANPVQVLAGSGSDYRALVCIFLFGGADAHNMVPPRAGNPNRAPYDAVRGAFGVAAGTELPLNAQWGLHPNMTDMKTRFDAGNLAVLLNVGMLKEPTDRTSYFNRRAKLPEQLFSHNTQQLLWQAAPAFSQLTLDSGWMGRASEFVGGAYNPDPLNNILPQFSIAGRVLQMQGYETDASVMQTAGAQAFPGGVNYTTTTTAFNAARDAARLRNEWGNVLQQTMAARIQRAIANQATLAANLAVLPGTPNGRFDALPSNNLAQQLRVVARVIASRGSYQHRRDVFFVSIGGWDNHENLNGQFPTLINSVDKAMGAFYLALQDLGMEQQVTTFTESEFGRTLVINTTQGSDHGWGGHHLVMGGAVNAGVYGTTDLTVNGPLDTGQGRIIPTTSLEQYYGALLQWWGIPQSQLGVVLENSARWTPSVLPILREPVSSIPTPAFSVDLMTGYEAGQLDPRVTYTFGTGGVRTMFDKDGNLTVPPQNLIVRSNADHLPLSGTFGVNTQFGAAATGGWQVMAGAGMSWQIVGGGTLPTGERFRDLRLFGTPTANSLPHLIFAGNTAAGCPVVRPFARYRFSLKAQIVGGSTNNLGARQLSVPIRTAAGAYISDGLPFGGLFRFPDQAWRRLCCDAEANNATAERMTPQLSFAVTTGNPVDITIRVAEPQLEPSLTRIASVSNTYETSPVPGPYTETNGAAAFGHRFDHDPVTLQRRGLRMDQGLTNFVVDSMFAGAGIALGTPGVWPTNMAFRVGSGVTGISSSVVRTGTERGMPFIDIRVFGTVGGTSNGGFLDLVGPGANLAAGASSFWNASLYAALKAGRLPSGTTTPPGHGLQVVGRISGAFDTVNNLTGPALLDGLRDAPITHQRIQASHQLSATANQVSATIFFNMALNEVVDFTLRIGGPMLVNTGGTMRPAPSFIPTWGNASSMGGEAYNIAGANFTSWYAGGGGGTIAATTISEAFQVTGMTAVLAAGLSDFTANNRFGIAQVADVGQVGGSVWSAGVAQWNGAGITTWRSGSKITAAIAVATNDAQTAARGVVSAVDNTIALPTLLSGVSFFGPTGLVESPGWVQSFRAWNTRLSAAQLSLVTAQ